MIVLRLIQNHPQHSELTAHGGRRVWLGMLYA